MAGHTITLRITKKVPKEQKANFPACCLVDGKFYFGWRDKKLTVFPLWQAIQKANILFEQTGCAAIRLEIEAEFSDTLKEEVLLLTKPN